MKKYLFIALIILFAGVLRFWNLTAVPPALNSDEIAIGYNAYSIMQTGKDEYGTLYPLTFRSFDDYKMPVYVYMVAGSMKLFGFGDFAVRFPSALLGTLTVLATYLFVLELFKKRQIALLSSLLLSISPWSVHFSRSGYEANVAVFFIVLGAYLFLKGLSRGWLLVLSSVSFSLAVWTYLTPRIFVPLLVVGLGVIYWKKLWKLKLASTIAIIVALLLLWPVARMSLSSQGQMRAMGVSAFTNPDDIKKSAIRALIDKENGQKLLTILDNRRITHVMTFLKGYLSHFDPNYLFLDKSIEKYRAPDVGLLYLFELPLLLTGLYMLVRRWSPGSAVILWWLAAAPVAAAFTLQYPHPVRTLVFLPALQIVSGLGLVTIWERVRRARIFIALTIVVSLVYYLHQYFAFLPIEDAPYWYVGRKEMTQKISSYAPQYDKIFVSKYLDFPYIFYLYYLPVDPAWYQAQGGTVSGGFNEQGNHLGNIEYRSISTSLRETARNVLFVGTPTEATEIFETTHVVDTVFYPDGTPAIVFFK